MSSATVAARFWKYVLVTDGQTDCWLWHRPPGRSRYPHFWDGQRTVGAHVWSCETAYGPRPTRDSVVLHLCENPRCVRPDHLKWGTQRENLLMGAATITAQNAAKTHCPQGHPYTGDNLRVRNGGRFCRACQQASNQRRSRRTEMEIQP